MPKSKDQKEMEEFFELLFSRLEAVDATIGRMITQQEELRLRVYANSRKLDKLQYDGEGREKE